MTKKCKCILFVLTIILSISGYCSADAALEREADEILPRNMVHFFNGKKSGPIRISLFDNIIYIPVIVEGKSLDFILDTGAADLSAMDERCAADMGLNLRKAGRVGGAGDERVRFHELDNLKISVSGVRFQNFRVITLPLKRMEPYWGKRKDGLLGGNILSRMVTEIDYDRRIVNFHAPEVFEYSGDGRIVPIQFISGSILIDVEVLAEGDEKPVKAFMLLDTGVRMSFFNTPFAQKNGLKSKSERTVHNITGFGIGGVTRGEVGRVASIGIGDWRLKKPVVEFSTSKTGISASRRFDGIIGADILSRYKIYLDYSRERIILEKGRGFDEPFEYDMSGIYFVVSGSEKDKFLIVNIVENSPAERAGLKKADEILNIEGIPAEKYSMESLKHFFRHAGRTITLTVKRGDDILSFSIQLERLI